MRSRLALAALRLLAGSVEGGFPEGVLGLSGGWCLGPCAEATEAVLGRIRVERQPKRPDGGVVALSSTDGPDGGVRREWVLGVRGDVEE